MRFLFIHQNLPGQYRHIIPALADRDGNQVVGVGEKKNIRLEDRKNFQVIGYDSPQGASPQTHHYLRGLEANIRRGQQVARVLMSLKSKGFVPDIVCAHHGWGETLFIRDVFPDSKLVSYFEFFYRVQGADVGFDPEYPSTLDDALRLRTRNAAILMTLEACDWGMSPTQWQRSRFPEMYRNKISAIHDGVNTKILAPDPNAIFTWKDVDGRMVKVTREDEVITFVNRNLEPYRGFHVFMRALPEILKRRPKARILMVGGDEVSYGRAPDKGTYREALMAEVGDRLDMERVHFLGKIPYAEFIKMLQVSTCHVYLTYPFVLSWSFLEAMACECRIVASDTPPVVEGMTDGENGLLVDFFDQEALAARIDESLSDPERSAEMARRARQTVIERYDLNSVCLPRQAKMLEDVVNNRTPDLH